MASQRGSITPWLVGGFVLLTGSKALEGRGDVAPYLQGGGPGSGLPFHLLALVVLIAAFACFLRAGYNSYRRISGKASAPEKNVAKVFADEPAPEQSFDADAALARYMEKKRAGLLPDDLPPSPRAFGRKQV